MSATTTAVRVRIAPSPTGYFHVGNARTAIFNWLFARQQQGVFVVRVEDTDRSRYVEGAEEDMYAGLDWLGLTEDESPRYGGAYAPYRQSERTQRHQEYAAQLVAAGHAYRCFCTAERLRAVRDERSKAGLKVGYDRHCRNLAPAEIHELETAGTPSVVRLKAPLTGAVSIIDRLRGEIRFDAHQVEDAVLLKSDGFPTYHLAVVADDHEMAISHVLRADEWLPSAPIQVVLYQAFGWRQPEWIHVPMVLNPGGKGKLSKRRTVDQHGQPLEQMTQLREFHAAGYLPEALFNYLALLGWSFSGDQDLFTVAEALARFSVDDIKSGPAAWSQEKLDWMNGVYLRALDAPDLARRAEPFLVAAGLEPDRSTIEAIAPLIQERMTTLADAVPLTSFLWVTDVNPSPADLVPAKLDAAGAGTVLRAAAAALAEVEPWTLAGVEAALRGMADERRLKPREAFQPVRVAITGSKVSPPLFETVHLLGRERSALRLAAAADLVAAPSAAAEP